MLIFKTIKLPIKIRKNKKYKSKKHNLLLLKLIITFIITIIIVKLYVNRTAKEQSVFFVENDIKNENIVFERKSSPEVLIFHSEGSKQYKNGESAAELGRKAAEYMSENYNLAIVHDVSAYDDTEIKNNNEAIEKGINDLLKKYPDIKVIIDIGVGEYYKNEEITTIIKNNKCAFITLVKGDKYLSYTDALKNELDRLYGGLVKYKNKNNKNFDKLFFEIEMGNTENSFDEVLNSMEYFCKALFNILEE